MQAVEIAQPTAWGRLDELIIEPSGLVRLHGWSQQTSGQLIAPRMQADGVEVPLLQQYRYLRPDVKLPWPLTGVIFEYLLHGRIGQLTIEIDAAKTIQAPLAVTLYEADYSVLFAEPKVRNREEIYGSGPPAPEPNGDVLRLASLLSGRVLDFGCGGGGYVAALRARDIEAFGLEIDRPIIRQHIRPDAKAFITLYEGGKAPFADNHFDFVTAFEVLEHIDDFVSALAEIARLAPAAIFSVPDIAVLPLCHRHNVVPWHLLESTHVNFFTQASLHRTLSGLYRDVEIGRIGTMQVNGTRFHTSLIALCKR